MKNKRIKIFIGSSLEELEIERGELSKFFNELNNKWQDRGLYIEPFFCEEKSMKMQKNGTQNAYDKYIENEADVCIFMFDKKTGEFTLEEFNVAFAKFTEDDRPDIFVYFKENNYGSEAAEFAEKIAKDCKHFYGVFPNSDTIKLKTLQYILESLDDDSVLAVSDGKLTLNNETVPEIDIKNLPAYSGHKEYQKLLRDIESLENEREIASADKDWDRIEELNKEIKEHKKNAEKIERDILACLNNFYKMRKDNIDEQVRSAYEALEKGDIASAKRILPISSLDDSLNEYEKNKEKINEWGKSIISKARAEIDMFKLDIENADRFDEIIEIFEKTFDIALNLEEYDFLLDMIDFLIEQNNDTKAIMYAEKMKTYTAYKQEKRYEAIINEKLGYIYQQNNKIEEAEKCFSEAISLSKKLYEEKNDDRNATLLAGTYNSVGNFYGNQNDSKLAEEYYKKSIELAENLFKKDSEKLSENLSISYINMAKNCSNENKDQEAKLFFQKSLKLREALYKKDPEKYAKRLADGYICFATFYYRKENSIEAENYYKNAIQLVEKFYKKNPEKFAEDLSYSHNRIATFYHDEKNMPEAEKHYKQAIKLDEELYKKNPEKFAEDLSYSHNRIATFYHDEKNMPEAEKHYKQAIKLREELYKKNPEKYAERLAYSYNRIADCYSDEENMPEAEKYYKQAIKLGEELYEKNPGKNIEFLAYSYNRIADCYSDEENMPEAEKYYKQAIKLGEELYEKNPGKHIEFLAYGYNRIAIFYHDEKNMPEAEKYYKKAIKMVEELYKKDPEKYAANLVDDYNDIADCYHDEKNMPEAEKYYKKAIKLDEELYKKNPEKYARHLSYSYNRIATFYHDEKNMPESEKYYKQAIKLREELYSKNPEKYAGFLEYSYRGIADCYRDEENMVEAKKYYKKVLVIVKSTYKNNLEKFCKNFAESSIDLGINFYDLDDYLLSEDVLVGFIETAKKNDMFSASIVADAFNNLGFLYWKMKKYQEAEKYLLEAIKKYEIIKSNDDEVTDMIFELSYFNLGALLSEEKKFEEAKGYLEEASKIRYDMLKNSPEQSTKESALEALKQLIIAYQALNDKKNAKKAQEKMQEVEKRWEAQHSSLQKNEG